MDDRIAAWQQAGDPRHVFLQCYGLMTRNVLAAIDAGAFAHPAWVHALLHRFADYYFEAVEAWDHGVPGPPAVWHDAFRVTTTRRLHVLQQLFLGVNAHINYDLVLTLRDMLGDDWRTLDGPERASFHADHCHINRVIASTIDVVQDRVVEQVSPSMDVVDKALGRLDEWLIARLITRWRGEVWRRATRLMEMPDPAAQAAELAALERDVLRLARRIALEIGPGARWPSVAGPTR